MRAKPPDRTPKNANAQTPAAPPTRRARTPVAKPPRMALARPTAPSKRLVDFPNPTPERDYLIHMEISEFSCLCPLTGQPDYAVLVLDYVPDRRCVELKSLKLYAWSFRDEGAFHEAVTNRMLDDVVRALAPRFARLVARFFVRGGIYTTIVAEHRKRGWRPSIELPPLAFSRAVGVV